MESLDKNLSKLQVSDEKEEVTKEAKESIEKKPKLS